MLLLSPKSFRVYKLVVGIVQCFVIVLDHLIINILVLLFVVWSFVNCHLSLVIDNWSKVIGHWSLVIGHWSLVIDFWSMVIGQWLSMIDKKI